MYIEQIPPHSIEAEEYVIGAILIDPDCMHIVPDILKPGHFYRERNRWIYEAMLTVWNQGRPPDMAVVGEELTRTKHLGDCGGYAALSAMSAVVPTSVHAQYYAEMIAKSAVNRSVIGFASELAGKAYDNPYDVEQALAEAESSLLALYPQELRNGMTSMRAVMDEFLQSQADTIEGLISQKTIPTGFMDLDLLLGGLPRSDMLILAARPGVGKSALALNIALKASQKNFITGIFSIEMSKEQVAMRIISEQANVNGMRLRQGLYTGDEELRIMDAVGEISELPLYVDDTPRVSLSQIRSRARRMKAQSGLDLLIVDYLQLVTTDRRMNRVEEVTEVTAALKGLARELNIPMLALSQLNRASETRTEHRPILADLRDSGSIEQDADTVLFLFREDMHITEEDWLVRNPTVPYPRGIAEVIVAKHRHGALGTVKLQFASALASFKSLGNEEA